MSRSIARTFAGRCRSAVLVIFASAATAVLAAAPATRPSADTGTPAGDAQQPFPAATEAGAPGSAAAGHPTASASAAPTSRPVNFNEAYGILVQRNIFSRARTFAPPSGFANRPAEIPLTPQQSWVLTGVTQDEGTKTYTAFLENVKTHDTTRHHTGESLAGGKITGITLNAIDYLPDGASAALHIDVGSNLEGHAPAANLSMDAATTAPAGETGATTTGATGAPAGSGGATDVLERLRQRRLQELKK